MQSIKSIFIVLIVSSFLGACSSGSSSDNSPSIGNIYADVYHQHTSFFDKWSMSPNRTIRFTVSAEVSDPQGVNNLAEVYIHDQRSDRYWDLLDGSSPSLDDCYDEGLKIFECLFYSSSSLDSVNLQEWMIVAIDNEGNRTEKSFRFVLPDGQAATIETFVYSSEYSGSTSNGVEALEAMTVAGNNIVFTSNPGTQSFHIEFDTTDPRAKNYGFAFYDGSSDIEYIGEACVCSPSIESAPIVFGQTTTIDIPWSEIDFEPGYDANNIYGLHIKLYDDPIEWIIGGEDIGSWFNYISYSEFITLP